MLNLIDENIPGVTAPMLYFGTWRSMFALHTEDMDLYSINYMHEGHSKVWYGVPPAEAQRVVTVASSMFSDEERQCPQFLRHKNTLLSPRKLRAHDITVHRLVQNPGEFVITWPKVSDWGAYCQASIGFLLLPVASCCS